MLSDKGVYTYTDSRGRKHKVPKVCAFSLDQIRRGDHICFDRGFYWHHAIVETADKSNGEVNVIEYSNSPKQFSQDNSSPPKNPGLAVVVRRKFRLENESVYVIKHDRCFNPETVVSRAKSKLGERKYHPVTNNCEHFALWCKTGISSSEQINNVKDAFETGVKDVKDAFSTGAWLAAVANAGVKEIVKTEVSREVTKEFVSHTIQGNGQQIVSSGVRAMSKQLMTETTVKTGQGVVKTGMTAMTKQVAAQSTVIAGKQVAKTGVTAMTKQVAAQSTVIAGKQVAKTGISKVTKQVVTQTTSSTGHEMVKTGIHVSTREVVTGTVSKTGQAFVKTGTRTTTKEVVTQTSTTVGRESIAGGLACAVAFESLFAAYDIHCAYSDKQEGKISQSEFDQTVEKRIVTGTFNVAGSTAGAAIGQVVFPVPVVGGFVGGIVGSVIGKAVGGLVVS